MATQLGWGMYQKQLQPGDVVVRFIAFPLLHYGIVTAVSPRGVRIVHNHADSGVQEVDLDEFANGQIVMPQTARSLGFSRAEVVQRARSMVGCRYDLTSFNCEHLANWAAYDEMVCKQGRAAWLGTCLLLGLPAGEPSAPFTRVSQVGAAAAWSPARSSAARRPAPGSPRAGVATARPQPAPPRGRAPAGLG